ncbi:unnamed protein product [Vicia faba]|uniref:Cation efflux protein transmembrane domain-containing protein n=1 Tax=Vicia faba TaxID=3906 RepID=A0AAV1ANP7_VICFA|nr:unnamed protein product [Vicia faba]
MRKLLTAVILCVIFMTVELVGGIKANSLAILTDATHLLSDVAAFAISLFSLWAARWEATPRQSYEFYRIEILGALVSIKLIWLLAGIIVYEAIDRLITGSKNMDGFILFLVTAFGLMVNIIMAVLLRHDHSHGHSHGHDHRHSHHGHSNGITVSTHDLTKDEHHHHTHGNHTHHDEENHSEDQPNHTHEDHIHHHIDGGVTEPLLAESKDKSKKKRNINVRGAYLHVLGDSIQSIGVMIGGAVIWYKPEWKIVDLICTLIFSIIILALTINMLRKRFGSPDGEHSA